MSSIDHSPTHYDAIVVGAGIAGLSAAATFVDAGCSVLLVDKAEVPGGSSAMSGGWFAFSGTHEQQRDGVDDSAEAFVADMRETGEGRADEALLRAYVENQAEAYAWLKQLGVHIGIVKLSSGQTKARSHHVDIAGLMSTLRKKVEQHADSTVLTSARGTALIVDADQRVTGIEVEASGRVQRFLARAGVVLATGGFSRSTDLIERFAPAQLEAIPYGGIGNTGDGLVMAWRLGAGVRDMGYVLGTFGSHPLTGDDEHELLTAFYMGAIIVNRKGRRFTDESASYKTLGSKVIGQPEGLGFEVFDSVIRAKSQPGIPLSDIDHLEAKGRVFKANTLEELAVAAEIDPDGLVEQVARYNEALAAGKPDEFGRTGLVSGVGDMLPIAEAPFYAYPAKALMTSTFAGLTVTPRAEVLRIDNSVIDGLYAAGELVGGFHGTAYLTGTALAKGFIFGRVAATEALSRLNETTASSTTARGM